MKFRIYGYNAESASGTWRLDNIIIPGDGSTALPIELLSFKGTAENNAISLSWTTASEINNDFVEVQKSTNGKDFVTFEKVMGAGDRFVTSRYSVKDPAPQKGKNYYRLKQVDFDGTETYSKVISVQFGSKQNDLNIFPTLVLSTLNLETDQFEDLDHLSIYNLAGQQVINDFGPANQVDCSRLPEGTYILRAVFLNGESHSLRFFKKG
ncbi:MAG: T9SS type A sorting domain-containing protein [Saprospiraceae bacterium]